MTGKTEKLVERLRMAAEECTSVAHYEAAEDIATAISHMERMEAELQQAGEQIAVKEAELEEANEAVASLKAFSNQVHDEWRQAEGRLAAKDTALRDVIDRMQKRAEAANAEALECDDARMPDEADCLSTEAGTLKGWARRLEALTTPDAGERSMSYDPVESFRTEIERFKSTNTFNPLTVTQLYVQGGVVLRELERLRRRAEAAEYNYSELNRQRNREALDRMNEADTAERQAQALRERVDRLEIQLDELIDQIERTLHVFGGDTEGRAQAEGAIAFARKVRAALTTEAEQQDKQLDLSGAVRVMGRMADSLGEQQEACPNCHEGSTEFGHECKACGGRGFRVVPGTPGFPLCDPCNGTGKAQQGEGDKE